MKSNKNMTIINTNYSNNIHKLSKNKEQKPKQKPISKTQSYAKNQRVKAQNQVEKSIKQKTHTCNLTILSYKSATLEIGKGSTECLGGREFREKMNSHKNSREKLKKFKNCSCFCKTRDFRDLNKSPKSRQIKPPKH